VVVDLAAGPLGGNVAGSVPDTTVVTPHGVTVIGAAHLPATVPQAASTAYSRNLCALLPVLLRDGVVTVDPADDIQAGVIVTHDGQVVQPRVRDALNHREAGS
jgi:NAD(P) transhydrogenase subunit alpha